MRNQILSGLIICLLAGVATRGEESESLLSPADQQKLNSSNELGAEYMRLFQAGKVAEAIEPARKSLALRESVFGPEDPRILDSLDNLAGFYKLTGRFADALPLRQRVAEILEKHRGLNDPATIQKLNNLATIYFELGKFAEAEVALRRAISGAETAYGADHPELAVSLGNLALACDSQAKYLDAESLYARALRIQEKAFGTSDVRVAVTVNNLAGLYEMQGDLPKAEAAFRRALKIREASLSPTDPAIAESRMNLGVVLQRQDSFSEALALHEQALKALETTLGPTHRLTATALNNLALTHQAMGNMPQALAALQQVLQVTEAAFGERHPATATSLNNLAAVSTKMGDDERAVSLYRRSLKITEDIFGKNHPMTARGLANLAGVLYRQGETTSAEQDYREAIRISESVSGPDHPDTGGMLNSLANLLTSAGRAAEAEPLLMRALRISERANGNEHSSTARAWNDIGLVARNQGKTEQAFAALERAVLIGEKVLGPEHPTTITFLQNLVLQQAEHDRDAALSGMDQIRRRTRIHVNRTLPLLSEAEQLTYLSRDYEKGLHYALSLAIDDPHNIQLADYSATWLANGKAVAQEALVKQNLAAQGIADTSQITFKEWQQVRKQLATLAMTASEPEKQDQKRELVARLTADEQRLARELGIELSASADDNSLWVTSQQIRGALPAGSVLVDIARVSVYNFHTKYGDRFWLDDHYAAWVIPQEKDRNIICIDLGLASEIDVLVTSVRTAIQNVAAAGTAFREIGEDAATQALMTDLNSLSAKIWKPLEPHLGAAQEIIVCPDSTLWLAPWNALPVAEDEFLVERYSLKSVISIRNLLSPAHSGALSAPVILANPLFDLAAREKRASIEAVFKNIPESDDATTRAFSAKSLLPKASALPNTAIEALAIQPNLEKYAGKKSTLYKESYALERVAKALKKPAVVSFATHGFFLPAQHDDQEEQPSTTGSQRKSAATTEAAGAQFENPLLRCGLLLSGCNNRDTAVGDDDGILTGLEITGIDLRGTELVVLSACETGIGDVRNGEGVAGLRQAFQLAGAKAVVSTLWQVPDRDSALLMSKFFEELAAGKSKADALRNAQLERIEKRRERYGAAHPFYWAAFTLTGN